MTSPLDEYAVWWLTQGHVEQLEQLRTPWAGLLPAYLLNEYYSLRGAPGRGRLWVPPPLAAELAAAGFQQVAWPESPDDPRYRFGAWLAGLDAHNPAGAGGIVFRRSDMGRLPEDVGVLTSLALERLVAPRAGAPTFVPGRRFASLPHAADREAVLRAYHTFRTQGLPELLVELAGAQRRAAVPLVGVQFDRDYALMLASAAPIAELGGGRVVITGQAAVELVKESAA